MVVVVLVLRLRVEGEGMLFVCIQRRVGKGNSAPSITSNYEGSNQIRLDQRRLIIVGSGDLGVCSIVLIFYVVHFVSGVARLVFDTLSARP